MSYLAEDQASYDLACFGDGTQPRVTSFMSRQAATLQACLLSKISKAESTQAYLSVARRNHFDDSGPRTTLFVAEAGKLPDHL